MIEIHFNGSLDKLQSEINSKMPLTKALLILWQEVEKAGYGRLVLDDNGHPVQFIWAEGKLEAFRKEFIDVTHH